MIVFVKLLLAHLLGDFLLQPITWVKDKEHKKYKSLYLYIHTFLHGFLALILVWEIKFIWFAVVLSISHGLIDFIKLYFQKHTTKRIWFSVDQILHLIVLVLISIIYCNNSFVITGFTNQFWIVITGFLLLTKPTSILIKNMISIWTP